MWPIIGSIALRRRSGFAMVLVTQHRTPLMKTFTLSTPWPWYPPVNKGHVWPLIGQDFDLLQSFGQRRTVVRRYRQAPAKAC